jgi:hypothetical protein
MSFRSILHEVLISLAFRVSLSNNRYCSKVVVLGFQSHQPAATVTHYTLDKELDGFMISWNEFPDAITADATNRRLMN